MPLISPVRCAEIKTEIRQFFFREDSFDPLTRIRRGRLYRDGAPQHPSWWSASQVCNGVYGPLIGIASDQFDIDGRATILQSGEHAITRHSVIQMGAGDFWTAWRVVDVETNVFGQQVFTLRGQSLLGALPEPATELPDQAGNPLEPDKLKDVRDSLDRLVDTYHRLQPVPTVDAARETARVIVAAWVGKDAYGKDLGEIIKKVPCEGSKKPENRCIAQWAASIISRFHPRGKSAEQEKQEPEGVMLRSVVDEDAECAAHLVGLLLREFGWAKP
jgi:hypothetical protein